MCPLFVILRRIILFQTEFHFCFFPSGERGFYMDISKYALFADVADTGNFTKSGERMGYTQPGVSHILKAMEAEFGFPLFVRTKQGVVPTHNAKEILPLVRQLLSVNEQLEQTISSLNGLTTGHLTIASFASIGRSWLPAVIHSYQQSFPGIEIELLEGGTDDIVNWVENSRADFGLLSKWNVDSLEWISLYEDPLMAILPKDMDMEGKTAFPIKDMADQPFVISAEGVDYDIHQVLKETGIEPDIRFSSMDDHVVISMVANNLGISILPNLVIGNARAQIQAMPLEPDFSRELGIGIKSFSSLTPAAQQFITSIQEQIDTFRE